MSMTLAPRVQEANDAVDLSQINRAMRLYR